MNKIQARLTCHHNVRVSVGVDKDKQVYCRFCGWQYIDTLYPSEWHVFCLDCQYGRWLGQSQPQTARVSRQHHTSRPTHRIAVAYDQVTASGRGLARETGNFNLTYGMSQPVDRLPGMRETDTTSTADDPPPF